MSLANTLTQTAFGSKDEKQKYLKPVFTRLTPVFWCSIPVKEFQVELNK